MLSNRETGCRVCLMSIYSVGLKQWKYEVELNYLYNFIHFSWSGEKIFEGRKKIVTVLQQATAIKNLSLKHLTAKIYLKTCRFSIIRRNSNFKFREIFLVCKIVGAKLKYLARLTLLHYFQSEETVNRTMAAAANYIRKSADVVGVAK